MHEIANASLTNAPMRTGELIEYMWVSAWARHLHSAPPQDSEPIVLCLVRDAAGILPTFIDHYKKLGAAHIVFLDNGSTDDTIVVASRHPDVSVYQCRLSFRSFRRAMKRWMVRRFAGNRWCIVVDSDEFLAYPMMETVSLADFLQYLNRKECNAVTALMLDMVSEYSFSDPAMQTATDPRALCRFYDASAIRSEHLPDAPAGIRAFYDGIRTQIFGTRQPCLTKFPVLRDDGTLRLWPRSEHFVEGARIADVSAVLLHYKFTADFPARVEDALRRKQHYKQSAEYETYARALRENPGLTMKRDAAREYDGIDQLPHTLVTVSDDYRTFGASHSR